MTGLAVLVLATVVAFEWLVLLPAVFVAALTEGDKP